MVLLTSAIVLILTSAAFTLYEVMSFKQALVRNASVLARIIAENSSAALAFENSQEATAVLSALKSEPEIVGAKLYDRKGALFAHYPATIQSALLPDIDPRQAGYKFENRSLVYFQPVQQTDSRLGTLVLYSSLQALYTRLRLYTFIVLMVMGGSLLMSYLFSTTLQKGISEPILGLAETAKVVSLKNDYSVRAPKLSHDEVGFLTDCFNQMLGQIQQNREELRAAHEQIHQHAQQLEKTVAERTVKLQQTIGELEAFSYSISHDMRAPLRAMSRYSQILLQDAKPKLNGAEQAYVERIIAGAQRLDRLIQDALSYSRVARAEMQLQPINLETLIHGIIDQYPQLHPGEAEILVKSPLHKVLGHEASLTQCLSNLLANAVKFVTPGIRPHVTISTQQVDSQVRICIQDNGIGIAPEDKERIFGMFARVNSEKAYEGTGVGLAIVRKAVERMGGRTGVESELGKGSVFWLELKGEEK